MYCILGPFIIFWCGEIGKKKGKKKKKPVTLGTGNHSHANMVANLNLLEVLMILRELETGSFRQAPDARNALHAVQSNADKYSVWF